jgi:acetolactate synthase I/II/III large subunit
MKVYEAVANAFVKEGTDTVFGLLGDGQLKWWPAMIRHGVKIVHARHEAAAMAMAEGWARATGRVGICTVTQGPGVSHITTSLIVATRSSTPVVVFASRTPLNDDYHEHRLETERLVTATGAGYIEVLNPSFAEDAVRQAFYRARLESRPIVLCVPVDIQMKDIDADGDEYQPSTTYYGGQQRLQPDPGRVEAAVKLISASRKPVVVIGRGASKSPEAVAATERLAKRIGALIATTLQAKGTLWGDDYHAGISGLFSRRAVMKLYEDADCVIAVGASLNQYTLAGGYLYPNARIIQINTAPHVLMGNDKGADCYVQADAELAVKAIEAQLEKAGLSQTGFRTAEVRRVLRDADRDPAEFEIEPGTLDPREVARVIDEKLPASVGVVIGVGHHFSFPAMIMKKPRSPSVFCSGFGCIGQGLPTAVGVGVAMNGAPVAHIEGDGGAMQNIQELDTAARLGLKILFMICNDEGFGAEIHKLRAKNEDVAPALIPSPAFADVGRVFGCRGKLVRTLEDLAAGVDEFMAGQGPMVMDIRVSRNVISIPYQRTQFGADV